MAFINIEIKARTSRADEIRKYLNDNGAEFRGTDHQTDTYFNVPIGRLKLREGNFENSLIFYQRSNTSGPKKSDFNLVEVMDAGALKIVLENALGILAVVNKEREIYYIDNVKFHLDTLPALGNFVEIEAGNIITDVQESELRKQCEFYLALFNVEEKDLVAVSYSDMVLGTADG